MGENRTLRPPRFASWLVELFTPYDQAESIPGDLDEEFFEFAREHGLRAARHWYWRQCFRSVGQLIVGAFHNRAWSIMGAVLVGIVLLRFSASLPEQIEFGILHLLRNHLTPYQSYWNGYIFWTKVSILPGRLLLCLLIGAIVGFVSRGNELVATASLAFVIDLITVAMLSSARFVSPSSHPLVQAVLLMMFEYPVMIVLGGWIVRDIYVKRNRARARV